MTVLSFSNSPRISRAWSIWLGPGWAAAEDTAEGRDTGWELVAAIVWELQRLRFRLFSRVIRISEAIYPVSLSLSSLLYGETSWLGNGSVPPGSGWHSNGKALLKRS